MVERLAEIGGGWRADLFARAISNSLSQFPKEIAEPIMRRYCADKATVSSHYPWLAFAIAAELMRTVGERTENKVVPQRG
jgi:hypothetical protein